MASCCLQKQRHEKRVRQSVRAGVDEIGDASLKEGHFQTIDWYACPSTQGGIGMKEYQFYGWKQADARAVTDQYEGIHTPLDLYDALSEIWCADTCAPRMRDQWTPENKTLGQCSITAFLAQDIFGGEVYGIRRPDGNFHCYNVVGDCCFDLTSEQFGDEVLIYESNPRQYRETHFAKEEKRLRYEHLKKMFADKCVDR